MVKMRDGELLTEYLQNGSEAAFAELVRRHVDLVFSTAWRQVGDAHLAEEVAQSVFCLLARKAGNLASAPVLAGWLYRATCFSAAKALRTQSRRRRREQEAAAMSTHEPANNETWQQLAPMLDQALETLGDKDRLAVLLRFFQGKPMREVGEALGVSEAAAKMRVSRSVDRLREFFAKRGVARTAAGLTALLASNAAEAAPASLAANISSAILSGAAASASSALSFFQIALLMTRIKAKTLVVAGLAALAFFTGGWQLYRLVGQSSGISVAVSGSPVGQNTRSSLLEGHPAGTSSKPAAPLAEEDMTSLAEVIASLRAALHSTSSSQSPGYEVIAAVQAFGQRRRAAFLVLREEAVAAMGKPEGEDLVWRRAIAGMGFLDKSVPETRAFLWEVFHSSSDKELSSPGQEALVALSRIGFEPGDIPALAQLLYSPPDSEETQGFANRDLAEWIAQTIRTNSAAARPFIPVVENLLSSPDARARFWAACALLEHEGARNPKLRDEIAAGLKNLGSDSLAWGSQFLQHAGTPAQPLASALLEAARLSDSKDARKWALLAAGKLDDALRNEAPEVAQALKKDEEDKAWLDKVNSLTATYGDLVPRLTDEVDAPLAARLLGEMGPAATNALPDIFRALKYARPEDGADILTALHRIDPQSALTPEDIHSILGTLIKGPASGSLAATPFYLLLEQEGFTNKLWCTREGFPAMAKALAARDQNLHQAFLKAVLEKRPAWKDLLQPKPSP